MEKKTVDLEAECSAYTEHMNNLLKNDKDLSKYVPVEGTALFAIVKDGVLLTKLVEAIKPGSAAVGKLNRDINVAKLASPEPGSKDIFKTTENQNIFLEAVAKLGGVKIINVGAQDIIDGKEDLILGLVWQIIRAHLLQDVNILSHPELIRLLKPGESIQTLLEMTSETLLLRWFNYHLKRAGSKREVLNFSESIKDGENYLVLMRQIAPKLVDANIIQGALESNNSEIRAVTILDVAEKLNSRKFVTTKNIISGNSRLNLAFTATLFNNHIGIRLPTEEEIAALFDKVENLTAQVADLQQQLAEAQAKLKAKSAESDKKIAELTVQAESWEGKHVAEAEKSTNLRSHVERLQTQAASHEAKIAELTQTTQDQKAAFERIAGDQSNVNGELIKQLQHTQEVLKAAEEKLQAEMAKSAELQQKLQEQSASSEATLKRHQSTSAKEHKSFKEKQKGELEQIIDLLKVEMDQKELRATLDSLAASAATAGDDELNVNLKALKWMAGQLLAQKKQLQKKVTDQDGQLSRMKQMNDLMADKVKEIAEEMNKKKK